jgi:CHASE3 domain sensor protein
MRSKQRQRVRVFARGVSLRRRVAYSLAIVRLILAPVILLAVYYLFRMSSIADRIVSVDAPAATLAQQASIEMLEARRAERNYLLLRDSSDLQANRRSVAKIRQTLNDIQNLEPNERISTQKALDALSVYQQRFDAAVSALGPTGQSPSDRIQSVVHAYERDLNDLLREARFKKRGQLIDELRSRVGSFDAQISETVQQGEPALRQVTSDLQSSSEEILQLSADLETSNWRRVQEDHREARRLVKEAEWALGIVSALTFVLSVWLSFVLPREVVEPLVNLKEAVDSANAGNYEIDFDIHGHGEVAQLAASIRNLIANTQ